jgi:hypothetical protein
MRPPNHDGDNPSRRLDGRADIDQWLAERKRALDRLMRGDELADRREQLKFDLGEEKSA